MVATSMSSSLSTFRPSHMLLELCGLGVRPSGSRDLSTNYDGDCRSNAFRRRVQNLSDASNTSLFITGLPKNVMVTQIFSSIVSGTVYSLHLCPASPQHASVAAKLVFTEPEAAADIMETARRRGLYIRDHVLAARCNRDGATARSSSVTRVLQVKGSVKLMNIDHWMDYFGTACVFELNRWMYCECGEQGKSVMEFRFAPIE